MYVCCVIAFINRKAAVFNRKLFQKKIANSMSGEHNSQATAKKAINTTIPNNYSLTLVEEAVLFLSDFFRLWFLRVWVFVLLLGVSVYA